MTITEKVAYLKGLADGLAIDTEKASIASPTPNSRLLTKKPMLHSIVHSSLWHIGAKNGPSHRLRPQSVYPKPAKRGNKAPCTQHARAVYMGLAMGRGPAGRASPQQARPAAQASMLTCRAEEDPRATTPS